MIVFRLSDILKERGISRRALARQTRLNLGTICKLANADHCMIDLRTLNQVCMVLRLQPGELLGWEPDDQR